VDGRCLGACELGKDVDVSFGGLEIIRGAQVSLTFANLSFRSRTAKTYLHLAIGRTDGSLFRQRYLILRHMRRAQYFIYHSTYRRHWILRHFI